MRSTTATRSIDDGDYGDKIESKRDRATTATSGDGDEVERQKRDRVYPLSRSRRDRNSKPQNVESSARITTFPDTHGKSVCSSLNKSHNPANTHFLRSTMTAEFLPFSSVKRYATTKVKVPPQLQKTVC
ncbi:Uncharacterized protein Rs2_20538 [Raphanus sativus]|nr:Uncharacterized protein Rs2_20538 [Raphanus sativus]